MLIILLIRVLNYFNFYTLMYLFNGFKIEIFITTNTVDNVEFKLIIIFTGWNTLKSTKHIYNNWNFLRIWMIGILRNYSISKVDFACIYYNQIYCRLCSLLNIGNSRYTFLCLKCKLYLFIYSFYFFFIYIFYFVYYIITIGRENVDVNYIDYFL